MASLHAALKCSHTTGMLRFFVGMRLALDRNLLFLRWLQVSIHKWPFLPGSRLSAGFRLRHTGSALREAKTLVPAP